MTRDTFAERTTEPDEVCLNELLGETKPHWDALVEHVAREHPGLARTWKRYGKQGWQLKITKGKAAAMYLIPHPGHFVAATALKGPALAELGASGLPASLIAVIEAAKTYPEGRPARVEVREAGDVAIAVRLLALKLS
ncbi:DUF3788 family protein [Nannocystaceae bacterium ST9]